MKKPISPAYEFPIDAPAWTEGAEAGAGIYFLDDRCHVAGHHSALEQQLLAAGALLVARLRFDRGSAEGSRPGHPVAPLTSAAAASRFVYPAGRN